MHRGRLVLTILAAAGLLAGCGGSHQPKAPADAVAQVGDRTIPAARLNDLLSAARVYYAKQKRAFPKPGTAAYRKLRDQTIKSMIQGEIFVEEADRLGVGVTPEQLSSTIETIRNQQFEGREDLLRAALKKQGVTYETFAAQQRVQLAEDAVRQKITDETTVSTAEARAYYAKHKGDYTTPPSREVRHLLVKDKALADRLYAELKGGASFDALVKRYSVDTASKPAGGKMTDVKGTFVPPFEKVAFALKTNEISRPVKSQYGWHIIQALGPVTPPRLQPFSEVESGIEASLLPEKQAKALRRFQENAFARFCDGRIAYGDGYSSSFCR